MNLTGLKPLYSSMIQQNIKRTLFRVNLNGAVFELIYFIDSSPHILAIGVRNTEVYFQIEVKSGFVINPYLGKNYGLIYKILGLSPNGSTSFGPKKFFDEINQGIPPITGPKNVPKPSDVAPYRTNVEESKKIYFYGWNDNDIRNNRVSPENLEKTRLWLGEEAYEMCKAYNISSRWTDIISMEKPITKPNK
ncbi:DUF6037 family protein (plasmid) [Sporosarcina psychrophila]|uniref:DUF6037 family protein n=1 Tax=Sporosarcina psychrophila TaxID=1476 RepID=UPI0030D2EE73